MHSLVIKIGRYCLANGFLLIGDVVLHTGDCASLDTSLYGV